MTQAKKQWHIYYMIAGSFYLLIKIAFYCTSDVM
jgi:hypothetical protein